MANGGRTSQVAIVALAVVAIVAVLVILFLVLGRGGDNETTIETTGERTTEVASPQPQPQPQPQPAPAACSDGNDNDGDGFIDGGDIGCSGAADPDETDPPKNK